MSSGRPPVAPSPTTTQPPKAAGPGHDQPRISVSQTALFFPTPIENNVENCIEFTNQEDSLVLFKVKTSDVNRYVVRPKVGLIQPRATTTVRFVLLAEHLPDVEAAKADRFSVHVRFARKGEQLNDPTACWKADNAADARLNFACKFVAQKDLPDGMSCKLETPTPSPAASSKPRARSHTPRNADHTPRSSVANSPAGVAAVTSAAASAAKINASQSQVAAKMGDPADSAFAAARRARQTTPPAALQQAASNAADTVKSAASTAKSLGGAQPATPMMATGNGGAPGPSGTTTTSSSAVRKPAGTRKSAFAQAFRPSVPTVVVIPLMLVCFAAGVHSEHWMAHVEAWLQHLHFVMLVLTTPSMAAPVAV